MAANTFDFKATSVIADGNIIGGYADTDDAIKIEADEDEWEVTNGADGEAMRHAINANGGTVTLTLMYTSASNAILQSLLNGRGKFTLSIRDSRGGYEFLSETAFVARRPDVSLGKAPADIEWTIRVMSYTDTRSGIDDLAIDG